ncbi:methyltransferase domain-containing protein [Paenibacillus popilliae]|uniref:Methyltransferase domain-containing protein n=1 Tax=Paenibacillus popilliae TaxID=78057 RepID=A0ABY3AM74_PAEPP|nr:methyltransferase domain-containing protein [Paenibacillus sp. SDF0028]TQR43696.1 methyltransferase domain-containing protein [Paenibacillus sp. SDF0028]
MVPKINANDILRLINKENNVENIEPELEINDHAPRNYKKYISNSQDYLFAKQAYEIKEFLDFHDEQFVINAYRGILHRVPDSEGLHYYLTKLRTGSLTKIDILGRLYFSREAKKEKVKIKGLIAPFAFHSLYKVPVLGYLLNLGVSLMRLPKIVKSINEFQSHMYVQQTQQVEVKNQLATDLEKDWECWELYSRNLTDKLRQVEQELISKLDMNEAKQNEQKIEFKNHVNRCEESQNTLNNMIRDVIQQQNELSNDLYNNFSNNMIEVQGWINKLSEDLIDIREKIALQPHPDIHNKLRELQVNLLNQERRLLILIEEVRKNVLKNQNSVETLNTLDNVSDGFIDSLYVSFEDKFRGTREDIKNRQKVYLPIIDETNCSNQDAPILDVGCGRGEWLELLNENGYQAEGVDMNSVMVNQCREMGLHVHHSDVLSYLRNLKDNSLRAVTGFHIIEHIPLKVLIQLFDEVLRVLQPGGVVIFETPNPESIWVGAYTFRSDPTHINPIVPDTIQFVAEQRGFINTKIVRLHKRKEPVYTGQEFVDELIYKFNMEQDFSIVGFKA